MTRKKTFLNYFIVHLKFKHIFYYANGYLIYFHITYYLIYIVYIKLLFLNHFKRSTDKETLSEMAVHYKTEKPLSPQAIEKLCSWDKHMAGHSLCKELYLSTLDLDLFTR